AQRVDLYCGRGVEWHDFDERFAGFGDGEGFAFGHTINELRQMLFRLGDADHTHGAYSITSSARASSASGMVRPSALAVFELITSSNFVGCKTGRSPGFAPFRTFPM